MRTNTQLFFLSFFQPHSVESFELGNLHEKKKKSKVSASIGISHDHQRASGVTDKKKRTACLFFSLHCTKRVLRIGEKKRRPVCAASNFSAVCDKCIYQYINAQLGCSQSVHSLSQRRSVNNSISEFNHFVN